jgi:hypothetical protein
MTQPQEPEDDLVRWIDEHATGEPNQVWRGTVRLGLWVIAFAIGLLILAFSGVMK